MSSELLGTVLRHHVYLGRGLRFFFGNPLSLGRWAQLSTSENKEAGSALMYDFPKPEFCSHGTRAQPSELLSLQLSPDSPVPEPNIPAPFKILQCLSKAWSGVLGLAAALS